MGHRGQCDGMVSVHGHSGQYGDMELGPNQSRLPYLLPPPPGKGKVYVEVSRQQRKQHASWEPSLASFTQIMTHRVPEMWAQDRNCQCCGGGSKFPLVNYYKIKTCTDIVINLWVTRVLQRLSTLWLGILVQHHNNNIHRLRKRS